MDAEPDTDISYDLRPYANRIVDAAMHRMKDRAKQKNKASPVILVLGNEHNSASHKLADLVIMKELIDRGVSFAAGIEFPNDYLMEEFCKYAGKDKNTLSPGVTHQIKQSDPDGSYAIKSRMALWSDIFSLRAKNTLFQFILDQKISARFNDAPREKNRFIDPDNPLVKFFMQKKRPGLPPQQYKTADEIVIRNHVIVHHGLAHAKREHVPLYIQFAGRTHITGNTKEQSPYMESLPALFREKGCPVIATFPITEQTGRETVPVNCDLIENEELFFLNIPSEKFWGDVEQEETDFQNQVLSASGLNPALYKPPQSIGRYKQEMECQFEQWKQASNIPRIPNE